LGNLGVGRVSPVNNVGGFVFSAASNTFNLLIRALKTQGRIDILSRPQIMTLDNQTAAINVGEEVPYISDTTVTATGLVTSAILRKVIGVNLQVTPRISPDGTVLMRVTPVVSSVVATPVNLGNGSSGTAFNIQQVDTTIQARDGETVAIGGLIKKSDTKAENKIPWIGDLPYIGALFRYRSQYKTKTELIVILTPHIVRTREERERILVDEARRMDWIMGDVLKTHGTTGMEALLPAPPGIAGLPLGPGALLPAAPSNLAPGQPGVVPADQTLPKPRVVPAPQGPGSALPMGPSTGLPPTPNLTGGANASQAPDIAWQSTTTNGTVTTVPAVSTEPQKEKRGWNLFRRNP
jgi:hypothetical protein